MVPMVDAAQWNLRAAARRAWNPVPMERCRRRSSHHEESMPRRHRRILFDRSADQCPEARENTPCTLRHFFSQDRRRGAPQAAARRGEPRAWLPPGVNSALCTTSSSNGVRISLTMHILKLAKCVHCVIWPFAGSEMVWDLPYHTTGYSVPRRAMHATIEHSAVMQTTSPADRRCMISVAHNTRKLTREHSKAASNTYFIADK